MNKIFFKSTRGSTGKERIGALEDKSLEILKVEQRGETELY